MSHADSAFASDILAFPSGEFAALRASLLAEAPLETAAFVFARPVRTPAGAWRLIAHETMRLGPNDYDVRTSTRVQLPPAVVAKAMARARALGSASVLVHSHPCGGPVGPSPEDLRGEALLFPAFARRVPGAPVARLIVGEDHVHAAVLGSGGATAPLVVQEVGAELFLAGGVDASASSEPTVFPLSDGRRGSDADQERFHRQTLAFGSVGQHRLAALRVAIVGLGGTGSVVAQQLAHLGVGALLLIDPDRLEPTNLNRVVGSRHVDLGRAKVDIGRDAVRGVNTDVRVHAVRGDVCDASIARLLLDTDFFFCCTDTHGSRAVLSQLAYQFLLPGIDVGVAIHVRSAVVPTGVSADHQRPARGVRVGGRVQMLAPGLACPLCGGILDPEAVRRDLLDVEIRASDPYIVGAAVPQPAVISINSAASSLAVTMFLSAVTGMPMAARHQLLRFDAGIVSRVEVRAEPNCPWCSPRGALARGDSWPTPGRLDRPDSRVDVDEQSGGAV